MPVVHIDTNYLWMFLKDHSIVFRLAGTLNRINGKL